MAARKLGLRFARRFFPSHTTCFTQYDWTNHSFSLIFGFNGIFGFYTDSHSSKIFTVFTSLYFFDFFFQFHFGDIQTFFKNLEIQDGGVFLFFYFAMKDVTCSVFAQPGVQMDTGGNFLEKPAKTLGGNL